VLVAIALGYAIYRGGIRINLGRFFQVTGFVLVLVAAGLLASSVHEFAEAGLIAVFQQRAVDLSWLIAPGSIQGALLTGLFGFQAVPTVAELGIWMLYAVPMSAYVLWPQRPTLRSTPVTAEAV
jgi:high-affinity iron transporter